MNEPKQKEITAAARVQWPSAIGFQINHRKHTLRVIFDERRPATDVVLEATSHRQLLEDIKKLAAAAA